MAFNEIEIKELEFNPFTKFEQEWALVASGDKQGGYNMMTVSWGGLGILWRKPAVTVYVRDSRYTRKFMDSNDYFTVSFYGEKYREALNICGTLHGDECDKVKESGLTPFFLDNTVAFEEADLIFVCRKLLHADVKRENSHAPEIFDSIYTDPGDLHRIFIGEAVKVIAKK